MKNRIIGSKTMFASINVLLLLFILTACTHPGGQFLANTDIRSLNDRNSIGSYRLAVGDKIAIKFFYNEKLNEELLVRPDGMISLQFIGDIPARGLTPSELTSSIKQHFSRVMQSSHDQYSLSAGDSLAVKFFYNEELNEEVLIRPDGMISLQLLGDVRAAGKTPAQLSEDLRNLYKGLLDSPEITVIVRDVKYPEVMVFVRETPSQRVYVGGEVAKPSIVPMDLVTRVLDAVIVSGGLLDTANAHNVVILRYNGTESPESFRFNLNGVITGETEDIILQPYDIVYVPKTGIAEVESFVRRYFYNLLPSQVLFNFPYYINTQKQTVTIQ